MQRTIAAHKALCFVEDKLCCVKFWGVARQKADINLSCYQNSNSKLPRFWSNVHGCIIKHKRVSWLKLKCVIFTLRAVEEMQYIPLRVLHQSRKSVRESVREISPGISPGMSQISPGASPDQSRNQSEPEQISPSQSGNQSGNRLKIKNHFKSFCSC